MRVLCTIIAKLLFYVLLLYTTLSASSLVHGLTYNISNVAGIPTNGGAGADGVDPLVSRLASPKGVAYDQNNGNIYIAGTNYCWLFGFCFSFLFIILI